MANRAKKKKKKGENRGLHTQGTHAINVEVRGQWRASNPSRRKLTL